MPAQTTFTKAEQEVIVLNAVWDMIDDMVNYDVFAKNKKFEGAALLPKTRAHQRLFNILLVDFLSRPQPRNGELPFGLPAPHAKSDEVDKTYLFLVRTLCGGGRLGDSPNLILEPVSTFSNWLSGETMVKSVWLPSIQKELDIRVRRIDFIRICGNISKHNFLRLEDNVGKIRKILEHNSCPVDRQLAYLLIPEFYAWFHDHVFNYHTTAIAEFLNNIRWGIFDYLRAEFERSYEKIGTARKYRFRVPAKFQKEFAKKTYWTLMNRVRSEPFFPRFTAARSLKQRY